MTSTPANESLNSTNAMWFWPDGLYMLIPLSLIWGLWFVVFMEHLLNLASVHDVAIRFQALFCRIVLTFPLVAAVSYLAAGFPFISEWMTLAISLIETYCVVCFYSLLVGLAFVFFPPETLKAELLKSFWTKGPMLRCGPTFDTGETAFTFFTVCVIQCVIFKPLTSLILATYVAATHSPGPYALQATMRTIAAISLIIAVGSILRMYKFLSEAPGLPLSGHNVFLKFSVVKLLFLLIIVNGLFLDPMIENGVIPIDPWICSSVARSEPEGTDFCQTRLLYVVLICEIVFLMFPACLSYRHHGLQKRDHLLKGSNVRTFLYYSFIGLMDLGDFISGTIVNNKDLNDFGDPEERASLLGETTMDTDHLEVAKQQ